MATPAAFSRLQLAAALLEYDNDPTNPDLPLVSAHDSAIFAHLRREPRKSTDYLGVSVPSEAGDSTPGQRRSRGSIDGLRNPFGADDDEELEDEEAGEVDLASWGLDQFIKDKAKGKGKAKAKSEILPNPHPVATTHRNARSAIDDGPRGRSSRPISIGTMHDFGAGGAFLDAENTAGSDIARPRSSADLERMQSPQRPLPRRRESAHALIETLSVAPPLHSVPFPSVSVRDGSPGGERPASRASRLDLHTRTQSSASMGSRNLLNGADVDADGSPFAVRPPSPDRASRFDPKVNHGRAMSNGSMASKNLLAEENPFAVRPPSPSRLSRFDPKGRARTISVGSMGTRVLIDNDVEEESRRDRPYSTVELLRPKILVMPSPLQNVAPPPPPPPAFKSRAGFEISSDGPPLPPGARSANRSSTSLTNYMTPASAPIASNSFTPNPRASLTLSQLAFRNTLMVGGQRDIAYSDIDRHLPRAMKEGEQAQFEELEEEESPVPVSIPLPPVPPPTEMEIKRAAGKLYGRSLIDNLEHRKAEIKQKARVFTGDERPSMMVRGQIRRSSTLIDPQTLGRPPSQNLDNAITPNPRQSLLRRNSSGGKPLLDMDGEKPPTNLGPGAEQLLSKSRSVFGVDTLWDLEMVKLKKMEAEEKAEAEARKKREEEEEERRRQKKKKGKSKGKGIEIPLESTSSPDLPSGSRVGLAPPTLPAIRKPILKRAPQVDDESESDSDGDNAIPKATIENAADRWVTESSDEEDVPRRTTRAGPRYLPNVNAPNDDDSEEDLPLTAAVQRVVRRASQLGIDDDSEEDMPLTAAAARIVRRATQLSRHADDDDEDEDKPLVDVLNRAKQGLPSVNFDSLSLHQSGADDDEDERPLGLRASRLPLASQTSLPFTGGEEDDDKPLAFHPEQQRRTQYQMIAQAQQQQQQQLMMQAQMQNSMFFNPAMMGSGVFTPMVVPPMMMGVPMAPPSPPPAHDAAKFGRVDRWRRDVAVEGDS
ncbi:uncharacterized protein EDB91DRAFT_1101240 [Suillus paluster]|uniref:uncharacterized protein n=1 Tax=Suillus paluster TaxID=48578 RepID=UPI001B86178B|nr:uncharacterized protein EDB91DRAFT_1101240 [Suillus paluster]KAG1754025.1 hypothetical protein EDB91DRAFT_1101240 [Suillus paluster]